MTSRPNRDPEQLLDLAEVCDLLGASDSFVRRLAKAETTPLRCVKVGTRLKITRSSYDAYLASLPAA